METFSDKWFTIYYTVLGLLILTGGIYFLFKSGHFSEYLKRSAESEQPPLAIRNILKYFFLFTIPCLILSFIPFSWVDFLFSLWSMFMVYIIGLQLVRWKQVRNTFLQQPANLKYYIRIAGAIMVAVSLVMFMLGYLVLNDMGLG